MESGRGESVEEWKEERRRGGGGEPKVAQNRRCRSITVSVCTMEGEARVRADSLSRSTKKVFSYGRKILDLRARSSSLRRLFSPKWVPSH
jgi:hypothetical protein